MNKIFQKKLTGERALFRASQLDVVQSVFEDGESPLKESREISVTDSIFKWKYPMWYSKNVSVYNTTFLVTARSGIWYTDNVSLTDCTVDAPKTFRRSSNIKLTSCTLPFAQETMWGCKNITLSSVSVTGDYFCLNAENIVATELTVSGNYAFDGAKNIEISNSKLISKDSFWNAENVVVRDSLIVGEYLGWNSKYVTLINCTVESNQGMCYMEGLKMINCKLINTDLAFEYSSVDADIKSSIVSIKNPTAGVIAAESVGEVILDEYTRAKEPVKIIFSGEENEV